VFKLLSDHVVVSVLPFLALIVLLVFHKAIVALIRGVVGSGPARERRIGFFYESKPVQRELPKSKEEMKNVGLT
jgi:hypothetical protein